ncbi:MAG: transglycosylase domain-containing protein [Propionibacteriaceae bacterium]
MPSPSKVSNKVYAGMMFAVVSVLSGLLMSGLIIPFAAAAGLSAKALSSTLENLPAELETPPQSEGSKIYLSDGTLLAEIYEENRTYKPLSEISPLIQKAQVAIEDHRFYEHGALDFYGAMRALLKSGGSQGGSTLTQQYVKLVQVEAAFASGDNEGVDKATERTMSRKIQELRYAIAMEHKLTKDQILERYLNIALYGDGAYGVEAAAHHFFNTTAKDLTLAQAAMLAGIVQNPAAFNPAAHPKAAIERRNTVLFRMYDLNEITKEEYEAAKAENFNPDNVQPKRNGCVGSSFPHLCLYAVSELTKNPNIPGNTPEERLATIGRSAYKITLTIDPANQAIAQTEINRRVAATDPVIATTAFVQPGTGKIRVFAQNRNEIGDQPGQTWWNYNASIGSGGAEGYQAGSTFKIFTVAAALEKGITPNRTYVSPATMSFTGQTFSSCQGPFKFTESYSPKNDHNFSGTPNMYVAAQQSVNTYFLQLEQATGICEVTKMAELAGIKLASGKPLAESSGKPSFTLGSDEVSPLSVANAYATFAARGVRCENTIIDSIETKDNQKVAGIDTKCQQTIRPEVADGVNAVMRTVVEARTGSGNPTYTAGYDLAGKTGTTDDAAAVWYAGYSPDIAGTGMITIDKTDPYWSTHTRSLGNMTLPKSGTFLQGYGSPDVTNIWAPILRSLLKTTPGTKFTAPPSEILVGKMVDVPATSGNADTDEAKLKALGLSVSRIYVNNTATYGTYLGITPTGKVPAGTQIQLMFSNGQRYVAPTTAATKKAEPTAPVATAPTEPTTKPS